MFSETYTGMNFFPLCTATVCPTISGMIVDLRDQVFSTFFSNRRFISSMRLRSEASTNGPFLMLLAMAYFLRRTMYLPVRLLLRVFRSRTPHGVHGCRPPEVLPSPPPSG